MGGGAYAHNPARWLLSLLLYIATYSNEGTELPHVHVERGEKYAKYWLDPIRLAWNRGYNRSELAVIRAAIVAHQAQLLARWYAYFIP